MFLTFRAERLVNCFDKVSIVRKGRGGEESDGNIFLEGSIDLYSSKL